MDRLISFGAIPSGELLNHHRELRGECSSTRNREHQPHKPVTRASCLILGNVQAFTEHMRYGYSQMRASSAQGGPD